MAALAGCLAALSGCSAVLAGCLAVGGVIKNEGGGDDKELGCQKSWRVVKSNGGCAKNERGGGWMGS